MNKFQISISTFLIIFGVWSCQPPETSKEEAPSSPDRNMGGMGVPRGVTKTSEGLTPGYLFYNEPNSTSTYLVNRKGEVLKEWKGQMTSEMSYLTDGGTVIRHSNDPDQVFPFFGGNSGRLEEINWEGDLLWEYELSNEKQLSHHDLALLPNGNILIIALETKSKEEALQAGRDPEYLPEAGIWPDMIVEVEPIRPRGGKIVWEWHSWDHMIQNYDPNLPNYSDPAEYPELLSINASAEKPEPMHPDTLALRKRSGRARNVTIDNGWSEIHHFNAVNYNESLDQIVISSPMLNEFLIIDHSTTTQEAASHRGGRWGKGGDILYRWGNPANYNRGDSTDQKLFYQHDIRWIEEGKPGAGNLMVYNNNIPMGPDSMNYSAVHEIVPPVNEDGSYRMVDNEPFGPEMPLWTYTAPDTISLYSAFVSGAHRIASGNTFITAGAAGRGLEVTSDGETVWEFWNPFRGKVTRSDGSPNLGGSIAYFTFRMTLIPADHPGLAGRSLEPLDPQPVAFMPPKPKEEM